MAVHIEQATIPDDSESLYRICAKTGRDGESVEGLLTDEKLTGEYYVLPFAVFDPALALVLKSENGNVLGFIVGTHDTAEFAQWFNRQWLPSLRESCRSYAASPRSDYEKELLDLVYSDMGVHDFCSTYPAQLHIDILPEAQGKGNGKLLMHAFLDSLSQRGVPGVHLGVGVKNERAIHFYQLFGFTLIGWEQEIRYYGMKL